MGLMDFLTTGSWAPPPPPTVRRQAQRAQTQARTAQNDARAHLSQCNTQTTGTLPCGLPIQAHPCDLKDLKVTERKTPTKAKARWVGEGGPPEEREMPAAFTIVTGGNPNRNPYRTNTVIEVTAGGRRDAVKTFIDVLIEEDYRFCAEHKHPTLVVRSPPDPQAAVTTLAATKKYPLTVYRKARLTDRNAAASSLLDIWPVRLGFQDYQIDAQVCGARKTGRAVGSQHATIRVYPNDEWEFEVKAPSLFKTTRTNSSYLGGSSTSSVTTTVNDRHGANTSTQTVSSTARSVSYSSSASTSDGRRGSFEYKASVDGAVVRRELTRRYSNEETGLSVSASSSVKSAANVAIRRDRLEVSAAEREAWEPRFEVQLKRNGEAVLALESIVNAINAARNIVKTVKDVIDAIKKFTPPGVSVTFGIEAFTGSLTGAWGYKEWTDQKVFFAFAIKVQLMLLKVTFITTLGLDWTIKGYGLKLTLDFKLEGSAAVSTEVKRKAPREVEWSVVRYQYDLPASVTATFMVVHDRVAHANGSVESGFDLSGWVGANKEGFGVTIGQLQFKGIVVKYSVKVLGIFEIPNREYTVLDKKTLLQGLRIPAV